MEHNEHGKIYDLILTRLSPNPDQPRKVFSDVEIQVLADSIEEKGLLQPILVKELDDGQIIIVSGERRFRAHQILKRETIPAWFTTGDAEELALVENLVREDLSHIETAEALQKLGEKFGDKSQGQLAQLIGKAESTISEILSLNRLAKDIRDEIRGDKRYALRELKKIAVKRTPEKQNEVFEKYKKRVSAENSRNRTNGAELHRKKIASMQDYFSKIVADDNKTAELHLLREEIIRLKDTIEITVNNIDMLIKDFDASKIDSKKIPVPSVKITQRSSISDKTES